jgi:hypothetical protein
VILFLDIEHPSALEDEAYRADRARTMEERRRRFELSRQPCAIRHYSEFRAGDLLDPSHRAGDQREPVAVGTV